MEKLFLLLISFLLLVLVGCAQHFDKIEHPLGLIVIDEENIMVRANNGNAIIVSRDQNGKDSILVTLFEVDETNFSVMLFNSDGTSNKVSASAYDFNEWAIPRKVLRSSRTDESHSLLNTFYKVDFTLSPVVFGGENENENSKSD